MKDSIGNVPPHGIEAEMSVLGAMLLQDKEAVSVAIEMLIAADFYRDAHCLIFESMRMLHLAGTPIDIVTLQAAMNGAGTLESVGLEYLMQLADIEFTSSNIAYYAKIVKEYSKLRQMIEIFSVHAGRAYKGEEDAEKIISSAEREILALDSNSQLTPKHRIGTMVSHAISDAFHRKTNGNHLEGMSTGLADVDEITNGLSGGDLFILAARPAMGKSALAASIALRVAAHGESALFFSLEMSEHQLRQRFLASIARVPLSAIRRGSFSEEEGRKLQRAEDICRSWSLDVVDRSDMTAAQIIAQARRVKPQFIVVDYLQYIADPESRRYANTNEIVTANVKAMKNLARELDCPVMVLSQLSRAVERREDKRPMLSDLRESGSIEQEADKVAFLYRPSYYEREKPLIPEGQADEVEFILAKNRQGETDFVKIGFFPSWMRFDDLYTGGY